MTIGEWEQFMEMLEEQVGDLVVAKDADLTHVEIIDWRAVEDKGDE